MNSQDYNAHSRAPPPPPPAQFYFFGVEVPKDEYSHLSCVTLMVHFLLWDIYPDIYKTFLIPCVF